MEEESTSVGKCYGLNCVSSEGMLKFYSPKLRAWLHLEIEFTDVTKLQWGLNWIRAGPNCMTSVLIRSRVFGHRLSSENLDPLLGRGEDHIKMEAEIGVKHLQAKENVEGLPATTRSQKKQERILPQEPLQRTWLCWHLDFRLLASSTMKVYVSVVWNHLFCGVSYRNSRKLI